MRKIKTLRRRDGALAIVWAARCGYDYQMGEYKVMIYQNGVPYEPATYYTDDRQDAILTAQVMLHRFQVPIYPKSQSWRGGAIMSQIDPNQPIWEQAQPVRGTR